MTDEKKEGVAITTLEPKAVARPGWEMTVVLLASKGLRAKQIAAETGQPQRTIQRMLARPRVQQEVARVQDGMRAALSGRAVGVGLKALKTVSDAMSNPNIPPHKRAELALRYLEATKSASAGPVAQTVNVGNDALALLNRLRSSRPAELKDEELQILAEHGDVVEAEFEDTRLEGSAGDAESAGEASGCPVSDAGTSPEQ